MIKRISVALDILIHYLEDISYWEPNVLLINTFTPFNIYPVYSFLNVHVSLHRNNIVIYIQQDATLHILFFWKLLNMFRVVLPPIIRSANNCIYSIWRTPPTAHSNKFQLFHVSSR